jgi:hypothetical protein
MSATQTSTMHAVNVRQLLLRRKRKVLLEATSGNPADEGELAAFLQNLDSLGYGVSLQLLEICATLSLKELEDLHDWLMPTLQAARGDKPYRPMYPNFPREVVEMSKARLYLNALRHYWTSGKFLPDSRKNDRDPLDERGHLLTLDVGTADDVRMVFKNLLLANTSISKEDKDDLRILTNYYQRDVFALVPESIPNRENKAFFIGLILAFGEQGNFLAKRLCSTATDVLRVAVAISDGDVSLAEACKFRRMQRSERRALLDILESQSNITEDMLRWKERWKRLGERLHPFEYADRFKQCRSAFSVLRNNEKFEKFNTKIELVLEQRKVGDAIDLLRKRPGDFARRLDHLLRLDCDKQEDAAKEFAQIAAKVSTPVLVQLMHHFEHRPGDGTLRVFLPKGEVGKAQVKQNTLPPIEGTARGIVVSTCRDALITRFAKLPSLGKCYLDPSLRNFTVPGSQRSAAKSLRTIARGSRLALPSGDTLRFFIWWMNGSSRTDLDLSAALFREDFSHADTVAYYNLKNYGGHHSGDIVDAPEGASEFIDMSIARCREFDVRYIMMCVNSYTNQPYCDLPECFAGWMAREKPGSGEIYEPRTVFDRLDLAANTRIALPAMFDLQKSEVIWLDLSLQKQPKWNNVATNLSNIQLMLKAFAERSWPSLYDLLELHATARGKLVKDEDAADTIFSVANETPFHIDRIASEFLSD